MYQHQNMKPNYEFERAVKESLGIDTSDVPVQESSTIDDIFRQHFQAQMAGARAVAAAAQEMQDGQVDVSSMGPGVLLTFFNDDDAAVFGELKNAYLYADDVYEYEGENGERVYFVAAGSESYSGLGDLQDALSSQELKDGWVIDFVNWEYGSDDGGEGAEDDEEDYWESVNGLNPFRLMEANPYHNRGGRFTSKDAAMKGGGSKSLPPQKKQRANGSRFVFTTNPCGRDARRAGGDVRCHDARVLRKPKKG